MLKAANDQLVILGIDDENVKRLKEGKPIVVDEPMLGINKKILIAYSKDLNDLKDELVAGELSENI